MTDSRYKGAATSAAAHAPHGVRRRHTMPFGAELLPGGRTRFRLWAPAHASVEVELDERRRLPLARTADGWHEVTADDCPAGTMYRFVLSDGLKIADPASRYQPADALGPSEVIDPTAYEWRDGAWRGRPWAEAVIYELHVGAFTSEGTFRAACDKLEHLAELGVTALEIMPVAEFPGARNWGYDGVLLFAPDASYGRPEDFKALIDAAHACGVMVLLDVVYNHFGPEGNFWPACAPAIFTERHHTPWGAAVNFDGPGSATVRELVIHNALFWLEEYHLDGLRLDAVHAILDDSPKHVLAELAERVRAATKDREVHLLLENEENEAHWLARDADGRPLYFDAQWNDDVHHVLHTAATNESSGYYEDYRGDTQRLGRALAEGFAFQGELMSYRGSTRGEPSGDLPPTAFVAFLQNHDQIGNRAFGERLGALVADEALRALTAVHLLLPQIPLLFMGEEWNATQPFQFFCDFSGDLGDAVRNGRRAEFACFAEFADPARRERIPDPIAPETFAASKLDWSALAEPRHAEWLERYRRLLAVRRREIVPRLSEIAHKGRFEIFGNDAVAIEWSAGHESLMLTANLSASPAVFPPPAGREIWREGDVAADGRHGAWSVRWAIGDRREAAQ